MHFLYQSPPIGVSGCLNSGYLDLNYHPNRDHCQIHIAVKDKRRMEAHDQPIIVFMEHNNANAIDEASLGTFKRTYSYNSYHVTSPKATTVQGFALSCTDQDTSPHKRIKRDSQQLEEHFHIPYLASTESSSSTSPLPQSHFVIRTSVKRDSWAVDSSTTRMIAPCKRLRW